MWSEKFKGNQKALPSLKEIVYGLHNFFCKYLDDNFQGQITENLTVVKGNYKRVFDFILHSTDCDEVDQPLIGQFDKRQDNDIDLFNPNSKAVCLILYLYSIEPPFYYYINKASRFMLESDLETLGPFARALHEILSGCESRKSEKILEGNDRTMDII